MSATTPIGVFRRRFVIPGRLRAAVYAGIAALLIALGVQRVAVDASGPEIVGGFALLGAAAAGVAVLATPAGSARWVARPTVLAAAVAGIWTSTQVAALTLALAVCLFEAALTMRARVGAIIGVAAATVMYLSRIIVSRVSWDAIGPLLVLSALTLATALGLIVAANRSRIAAVRSDAAHAAREQEEAARAHALADRIAVARELHDIVGHHLALANIHTAIASRALAADPEKTRNALLKAASAIGNGIDDMAVLVTLLRTPQSRVRPLAAMYPAAEDDSTRPPAPSLNQLPSMIAAFREAGLQLGFSEYVTPAAIDRLADTTAYRVIQEALTNAHKHAMAQRADLSVTQLEGALRIVVANATADGRKQTGGHGLTGMRERVELLGGTLAVTEDGGLFLIDAMIPTRPSHTSELPA